MRFLIACSECRRQFDVTGRPEGARFRCTCGGMITVTALRPHDASVIRCSSCGAPREGPVPACRFCGSEFTLHERDLDTICPGCMARASSRARFCHHCSTPLMRSGAAAPETEYRCPVCSGNRPLASHRLGRANVAAYECVVCGGLWIEKEVFEVLADRARAGKLPDLAVGGVVAAPAGEAPETPAGGPAYRPCVLCGALMNRRNYGRKSGVILDVCARHGLWFDLHELDRLLRWIREGGEERTQAIQVEEDRTVARQKRIDKEMDSAWPDEREGGWLSGSRRGSVLEDLLSGDLVRAMTRLFD